MTKQTPTSAGSTPTSPQLAPGRWRVNTERSSATFSARGIWGVAPSAGSFDALSGTATLDSEGLFGGELVIPTKTLDTRNPLRDRHLKSAEFFHVHRYPEMKFVAGKLTESDEGHVIHGELFVRDRSVELALPVQLEQERDQCVAISAEAVIERAALGLGHSPLGMIRGPAKVQVRIVLERER